LTVDPRRRRALIAAALDVAAVLVFVAAGRRSHDVGSGIGGVLETAAPFLIGLGVGWTVARAWCRPMSLTTGIVIWPVTLVTGMVLRNLVFDRGTAASFVVVATLFLGACLIGWRLAAGAIVRRRQNSTATAGTS
jgi:hypothetical protein